VTNVYAVNGEEPKSEELASRQKQDGKEMRKKQQGGKEALEKSMNQGPNATAAAAAKSASHAGTGTIYK
jgi:hypothetical protein